MKTPSFEVWYEFASTYSYLTLARIGEVVRKNQLPVVWRPFLLGPIFKETGRSRDPEGQPIGRQQSGLAPSNRTGPNTGDFRRPEFYHRRRTLLGGRPPRRRGGLGREEGRRLRLGTRRFGEAGQKGGRSVGIVLTFKNQSERFIETGMNAFILSACDASIHESY